MRSTSRWTIWRSVRTTALWIFATLITLWCAAALFVDLRARLVAYTAAVAFLVVSVGALAFTRRSRKTWIVWTALVVAVMTWWFSLSPSNNRNWQPDVARLPWAEMNGDKLTVHNVRNFDYVTETEYTPHWETRTVNVSEIEGLDLFVIHWGSPLIAHGILSFQFRDSPHLAFSVEARKTVGQSYSAIQGFFRQYNLIYIAADERDVVRVRTNFRPGEDVRLYRTKTTPADARRLFLAYIKWMNELAEEPRWYNALTQNCTSGVTSYLAAQKVGGISLLDWRTIVNGKGDEMLYDLGDLETGGLSFGALSKQALINPIAKTWKPGTDFSALIRAGRTFYR